jgi:hypothetical protein
VLFGVYPKPLMDPTAVSVEKLIADYHKDVQATRQARVAATEEK